MQQRNFMIDLIVNMLALAVTAWIVPGITPPATFIGLAWAALIFGLVNAILRPILMLLSLPFIVITLGLFIFVLNAILLMIVGGFSGLAVAGFGSALIGAIVLGLVNMVLGGIFQATEEKK